jgi:Right handed beta helix region
MSLAKLRAVLSADRCRIELPALDRALAGRDAVALLAHYRSAELDVRIRPAGIAHAGDSRAYLLRDGQLTTLTRDHTVAQHLVDEGRHRRSMERRRHAMASPGVRTCLVSSLIACLTSTSCDGPHPGSCGGTACLPDGGGCRSSADCASPGAGVCDVEAHRCVQCTASDRAACAGSAPVCGTDETCRACGAHEECDSKACALASGSCAAESDVAYVALTGTDNATCRRSAPCASLAAALTTARPYVKIHGAIDGAVVVDQGRAVTFLADPGAALTRGTGGDVLTVQDAGTSLAIYDLAIAGAQGAAAGISVEVGSTLSLVRTTVENNAGGGVVSAGALTIDHSTIANNGNGRPGIFVTRGSLSLAHSLVSGNRAGGVQVAGPALFAIVSNLFVSNGIADPMGSLTGAVGIEASFASTNLLEFNTFYKNLTTDGVGAAIWCDPTAFAARANILFNNGTATNLDQTSGTCAHVYSLATPGRVPTGTGNQAGDPRFVDAHGGNFHLQAGSPAIGAASALAPLTGLSARDFDDHPRVSPVNLGAYQ